MTEPTDAAAAYQNMLADAQALDAKDVVAYRVVPDLAIVNVKTSMALLARIEGQMATHLPQENLAALQSLPELALAVKYAAMQVEQFAPSESEISLRTAEGWQLRGILLAGAKGLVAAGVVPAEPIEAIAAGRGTRDMAEDNVNLAEFYRTNESLIAGKHAVGAEQIKDAAAVGAFLMQHLRPTNAPGQKSEMLEIVDIRNRMATLLMKRYERLRAVAHYFLGEHWSEHVPALMSRHPK